MTFLGKEHEGQIDWEDPASLVEFMETLRGQRVVVTIEPLRTNDANAAWQSLAKETSSHTGNDAETVRNTWKQKFLTPDENGEYHTSRLSRDEFYEFFIRCEAEAADYGVPIRQRLNKPRR